MEIFLNFNQKLTIHNEKQFNYEITNFEDIEKLRKINEKLEIYRDKIGVYILVDRKQKICYVGKSVNLAKRLKNHMNRIYKFKNKIRQYAERSSIQFYRHLIDNKREFSVAVLEYSIEREILGKKERMWQQYYKDCGYVVKG